MAVLLVRHGQASFGQENYDRLSPLGERQSHMLGRWLASQGRRPTRVVCGGLQRHRQTLAALARGCEEGGLELPPATVEPALDEFDHRAVIGAYLAANTDHPAAGLLRGKLPPEPRAILELMLAALSRWVHGGDVGSAETWIQFQDRTVRAFEAISGQENPGDVWVVSSGGVISQFAQRALGAPADTAVRLNLTLRNSALTELRAHEQRWHLHSWNELPHLASDAALWTYF